MNNLIFEKINNLLNKPKDHQYLMEVLSKAKECKGLNLEEVAALLLSEDKKVWDEAAEVAKYIKKSIYGPRLVIFAPLYLSNYCTNDCLYCAFRKSNQELHRKKLATDEIGAEVKCLSDQGHKRLLLVSGEDYSSQYVNYLLKAIETTYQSGDIRRVNINIAPLKTEEFKLMKQAGIGTYQLFQESYHLQTYQNMHPVGTKSDYNWRISAFERALAAGIDDYGMGVLFGLYNYKFELLALLAHAQSLDEKYGVGPHTISVPRWRPAPGAALNQAPWEISDEELERIVIAIRLAVPYTGIILSTREAPEFRDKLIHLGVSQLSAGSSTAPGGYITEENNVQFAVEDYRSLNEVVDSILTAGYVPSFCTACYRRERTGNTFMSLAKTGQIKEMCQLNALLTLKEHLIDYALPSTVAKGNQEMNKWLERLPKKEQNRLLEKLGRIEQGERDLFF